MLVFEKEEITCGIILLVSMVLMLPFYLLTIHYRHFAPLRDVQPILCLLTHGGYFMFIAHLFLAWRHEAQLCYELAVLQLIGCVLLYGCFLCKHYSLHKRYRMVTTQLPTPIVFALSAFPFLLLSTYRVATRQENRCPNVDVAAGALGLLVIVVAMVFFVLKEHPSSHFVRAKYTELGALLVSVVVSFVHQWITRDEAIITMLFACALASHVSLLSYVLPPIRLALQHGNEFTDEQQRILNDSVFGAGSPLIRDELETRGCGDACIERVVNCLRAVLTDDKPNESLANNNSIASTPGAQRDTGRTSPMQSRDRLALAQSPARARQEAETQHELSELIAMIQEGDLYRLQKIMTRRGVALTNLPDSNGRTPLHHAVRHGDLSVIRFLLAMGADANKFDRKGRAPLHEAVRTNSKDVGDRSAVITELLRSGAVVNLPTSDSRTALHLAVQAGLLGAVNTLLRHDANPLFQHDKEDPTLTWQQAHVAHCQGTGSDVCRKSPLTIAVEMGDDKLVSSMLHNLKMSKSRLNFDIRCIHGMTLLHIALCLGNHAVVEVLLKEGSCSPWSFNEETSMNCFHMAVIGDSEMCVCAILSYIAAPDLIVEESEFSQPSREAERSSTNAPKRLQGLGTGLEHTFLFPGASTSSMPQSPAEAHSRGGSVFEHTMHKRVQYGCSLSTYNSYSASPSKMGFGEAMAVLREHIPHASAEASKVGELEAAVDKVAACLRAKSNLREMERVQCALIVVSKRLRFASSRSVGMLMSAQSLGGGCVHSMSGLPSRATEADVLASVQKLLRQHDNVGMTPLHYAIQQQNACLVHILAAYGAVASTEELPPPKSSSASQSSFDDNQFQSLNMLASDGGLLGAALQYGGVPRSPPCDRDVGNDTQAFLGSLTQPPEASGAPVQEDLEEISLASYRRDIRRYVEDESAQERVTQALMAGIEARRRYMEG